MLPHASDNQHVDRCEETESQRNAEQQTAA